MIRDVDHDRLRAAQPLDRFFFQDAKQLHLDVERQVANFVEEDGRMVGQLEPPDLPRQCAGERALSRVRTTRFRSTSAESPHS